MRKVIIDVFRYPWRWRRGLCGRRPRRSEHAKTWKRGGDTCFQTLTVTARLRDVSNNRLSAPTRAVVRRRRIWMSFPHSATPHAGCGFIRSNINLTPGPHLRATVSLQRPSLRGRYLWLTSAVSCLVIGVPGRTSILCPSRPAEKSLLEQNPCFSLFLFLSPTSPSFIMHAVSLFSCE